MKRRLCKAHIRRVAERAEETVKEIVAQAASENRKGQILAAHSAFGAMMNFLQETHHEASAKGGAILVEPPPPAQPFSVVVGTGLPPAQPYHTLSLHADELLAWWVLLSKKFPNFVHPPQASPRRVPFRDHA